MKLNFSLKTITLFLFVLFILGDIITTMMVMSKHKIYGQESETSPLVVLGIPLWIMIIIKLIVMIVVLNYFIKYHHKRNIYIRYIMISILLIIVLIYGGIIANNLRWYKEETKDIRPLPKEERISEYNKQIMDMKVVENIVPKPIKKIKIPMMVYVLLYNFINFCVWLSFEKKVGG